MPARKPHHVDVEPEGDWQVNFTAAQKDRVLRYIELCKPGVKHPAEAARRLLDNALDAQGVPA